MFDKNKFAKIIKNIKETYISQEEFSQKSEIGRTYLSQYMNMKLNEPPKPKILKKLADASNGITTYEELMIVCGYVDQKLDDIGSFDIPHYQNPYLESNNTVENFILDIIYMYDNIEKLDFSEKEKNILMEAYSFLHNNITYKKYIDLYKVKKNKIEKIQAEIKNEINSLGNLNAQKLINSMKKENISEETINLSDLMLKNLNSSEFNKKTNVISNYMKKNKISILYNIPVLGKITAGQPILAEEYLEGYLPVDPNIYGMTTPDDYFYLKVSGESMNLKVHNGDYALIHKQDYADDGDIIVAIVNGDDEATLKKYKRINENTIALEPMSTLPMETIYVDLKDKNFKIIGKAIGQFGKF